MKHIIRIVSILLVMSLIFALVSCGNSKTTDTNNTSAPSNDNTGNDTENQDENEKVTVNAILDSLPSVDYGEYEFKIWTTNRFNSTLEGRQAPEEEQTGDPVNDALYTRDKLIEEKYNINIKYTVVDEEGVLAANAKKSVTAGDNAFDFFMDKMMDVTKSLAQTGLIYDFNEMPNVDLTKPWWSKYAIRDLTINGKFYLPTGDISPRYSGSQYLLLFNKKLFTDMNIAYPYQTVLDGNWTLDEYISLTKGQTRDLNGDGAIDKNDFYGAAVETMTSFSFMIGCGEGLSKIADGNPVLNVKNERTQTIINKLASFWGDSNYMYYPKNYNTYDETPVFKEDRALFVAQTGTNILLYKDMDSDFGILPLPKYDASQPEYYSYCQPYGSVAVAVPQTAENVERTGMIIEALAAASRYTSTPAAYDVTLKTKYSRDNESEAMLDLICEGSRYDFAFIYDWGGVYTQFVNSVNKGDNFVSKFESIEAKAQSAMEKTINTYIDKTR